MENSIKSIFTVILLGMGTYGIHGQQAGTVISYFDASLVQSILNQEGCTGIRIYPAIQPSTGKAAAMVVGVDKDGNEIYSTRSTDAHYQLYAGGGDQMTSTAMDRLQAAAACKSYYMRHAAFAADFTSQAVHSCLTNGSAGMAVSFITGQDANFGISPFTHDGQPKSSGATKPGEPCPSACDEAPAYLVFPQ